jgi:hypothetical protein
MESSVIAHCDFDSGVEREHAYFLEYERQMGRIEAWKHHLQYPLIVNGKEVAHMIPDFTVYYPSARIEVHEIKGGLIFKDEKWALQRKIFQAVYPHILYRTFDKFKKKTKKKSLKTWDKQAKRWIKFQPRVIEME